MKIETKYNLSDEIWLIEDQRAKRGIITCIDFKQIVKEDYIIIYSIRINGNPAIFSSENNVFKTKEELIASL